MFNAVALQYSVPEATYGDRGIVYCTVVRYKERVS